MSPALSSLLFVGAAVGLVAVLSACGGSGDDDPAPTSSSSTTSTVSRPRSTTTSTTMRPTSYEVEAGDSLGGIAADFDVTVEELAAANGILDPNVIQEGQVLVIPAAPPTSSTTMLVTTTTLPATTIS